MGFSGCACFEKTYVPRKEFSNAVDGMICNTGQDMRQISFRIEVVQFRRADQAVYRGSAFTASIGSGKQIILTVMKRFS